MDSAFEIWLQHRKRRQLQGDGGTRKELNDKHERRIKKKQELEHKREFRGGKAVGNDESAS